MKPPRLAVQRLVVAIILAMAFLVMASVFAPDRTQASDREEPADDASAAHSSAVREAWPSLGQVVNDRYTIKVYATPTGPRYSVYDRDGAQLGALLTAEQVAQRFPDLPLPDAYAADAVQMMDTADNEPDW